ncbi:MAG TPA: hypothetical protein VFP06_10985 [Acidimicrobiales bacterium]|nr:hypothetical protein [Acidimicrobiales bacterium]
MAPTDTAAVDAAALDAAERYVLLNARLIERHRFARLFRDGPAEAVVAALRLYGNPDGGFGNGLEPDLRGAGSQPEPVAFALRILHETGGGLDGDAAPGGALVRQACDWLATATTPDGGVPWVLPSVTRSPRGPLLPRAHRGRRRRQARDRRLRHAGDPRLPRRRARP